MRISFTQTLIKLDQNAMAGNSMLSEFWDFLKVRKKFWLAPIILLLLALGALIVFTESSALAPFIYALF